MVSEDIKLTEEELYTFYEKYFKYFNSLNSQYKRVFVTRAMIFVRSKKFVALKNMEVNNKVKAIIAASAIQLTLGLNDWQMNHFHTIIVFPSDFKNAISGLSLKGETNLSGFISLSFKSFIEGYRITNDNLNLGLHEFTHALRFNGIRGEKTDVFFENYFEKWFCYANEEYLKLKKGAKSIFRNYGGSNINEFLSVVIEHYFESPIEFANNCPELFTATGILLNQQNKNGFTLVGIRQELLNKQSSSVLLSDLKPKQAFFMSPGVLSSYVILSIGVITFLQAGLFSFPTLFVFFLYFLLMVRNDFYYNYFTKEDQRIVIKSGFMLFKNRKTVSVVTNYLIKVDFRQSGGNDQTVSFVFFDKEGNVSEQESVVGLENKCKGLLVNELRLSMVWVNER